MTVGKTFVSGIIRKHHYEIQVLRKQIKRAQPKAVAVNQVWGIDMTGKTDTQGRLLCYLVLSSIAAGQY